MNYDDMCEAVKDGKNTIRLADIAIKDLAKLLVGRLRIADIPTGVLVKLKRELRDFNMQTCSWKE